MTEVAAADPSAEVVSREGLAGDQEGNLGFASEAAFTKAMGLPDRKGSPVGKPAAPRPAEPGATGADGDTDTTVSYEFAGKVYTGKTEAEARKKAEHALSTHRGLAAAETRRAQSLAREVSQLKDQLARASARPAADQTPTPPKPAVGEAAAGDANLLELSDADWAHIQSLRKAGEHERADAYLLLKYEDALKGLRGHSTKAIAEAKAELLKEFESLRKPLQEKDARDQQLQKAIDAFRDRGELLNDEGEHVYPDMQDDDVLAEVSEMFEKMVNPDPAWGVPALPPEFALTPAGVHVAYAMRFYEVYEPLVRLALQEGYRADGSKPGQPAAQPAKAPGRMSAPILLPRGAPRREPAPKTQAQAFKDALVSKSNDELI